VGLVLAVATAPAARGQEPAAPAPPSLDAEYVARATAIRTRVRDQCAELATWCETAGLWLPATYLARDILTDAPDHPIRALAERLGAKPAAEFKLAARRAGKRGADAYAARRRAVDVPAAKDNVELAKWAESKQLAAERVDACARAYRHEPSIEWVQGVLAKAGYDVVYNYGLISATDKAETADLLKRLGGKFLGPRDREYAAELKKWPDAWGFQTQHYLLLTNAPHALVFRFAQECENLWEGLRHFCGRDLPLRDARRNERLVVWLFGDELSYGVVLQNIGEDRDPDPGAAGFYGRNIGEGNRAYFFWSPRLYAGGVGTDPQRELIETFYHEGTHQLLDLQLAEARKKDATKFQSEWVSEGIALYLETMQCTLDEHGRRRFSYGYGDAERGFEARNTTVVGAVGMARAGSFTPIEEFTTCSYAAFQERGVDHYSQAFALSHYLVHADGGRHKRTYLDYVRQNYTLGGSERTLWDLCRTTAPALHDAYVAWIKAFKVPEGVQTDSAK